MSENINRLEKKSMPKKEIVRTWLAGHSSCTLIVPRDFAKEYGLDKPSHVILEKSMMGFL